MTAKSEFFVVVDFDGTITQKDIGNELCLEVIPELFKKTIRDYRAGLISLKDMQQLFWGTFPMPESEFVKRSMNYGDLRTGANEFFEYCADSQIKTYVASCGLRPYIEPVLKHYLSPKALSAIADIKCNEVVFGPKGIEKIIPPDPDELSPYPLHKGMWCQNLKNQYPNSKVLAVGNGSSDRSFVGFVDSLCATESLADYCKTKEAPYMYFDSFFDILEKHPWFA